MSWYAKALDVLKRVALLACTGVLLAGISGCMGIPDQELTNYREAYIEAQKAGDLLYDDLAAAVVRAGGGPAASNCVRNNNTPTCFDPSVALNGGAPADIPAIRARRLALSAIETYNLAVVDVLEGKRGDALATRIDNLKGLVGDLLLLGSVTTGPLPALVAGNSAQLLGALVKRLDRFASQQQVRASLVDNAETVETLITLLIRDTKPMYNLYRTSQGKYAVELELSGGSRNKAALAAYARIASYHDQLTAYVQLLAQTRSSFAQLIESLNNSQVSTSDLRATIREAIEIRKAAENFWAEVRKAR
ncbi:MAG: hypothetical protein HWE23_01840 [Rhodobacteraceae bacterium]|nr:hypothetical protein [Paracoccaceae bacterium]